MRIEGEEHSRQRTRQVQGHCGGNTLGVSKERREGLSKQEGGDMGGMGQIIQGFVAMKQRVAFTRVAFPRRSHQRGQLLIRLVALL